MDGRGGGGNPSHEYEWPGAGADTFSLFVGLGITTAQGSGADGEASSASAPPVAHGDDVIKRRALEARAACQLLHNHKWIREFKFVEPRVKLNHMYKYIIEKAKTMKSEGVTPSVLDIGCCMGTDLRQMFVDGVTIPENSVGIDCIPEYFDIGHKMFAGTGPQYTPVLRNCNALDDAQVDSAVTTPSGTAPPYDIIYTGAFLHLLDYAGAEHVASTVRRLLKPGGIFFGRTLSSSQASDTGIMDTMASCGNVKLLIFTAASIESFLHRFGFTKVSTSASAPDAQWSFPIDTMLSFFCTLAL
ncbi:hypothetical protein Pelo_827 [Pelomyxa schiedti]|nr:hypothetical protein Pelo_827 [Pelomyxa schiedti]